MRIEMGFLSSVISIALVGCLNTDTDTDIDTASEAITATATVATVEYLIENLSSSTITLDTASCSPSTSIFPTFFISSGSTVSFSAKTTTSVSLGCNVRYQDQTGVQGCQFQVSQFPGLGSASANAYKGGSSHIPSCGFSGTPDGSTAFRGVFTMQTQ